MIIARDAMHKIFDYRLAKSVAFRSRESSEATSSSSGEREVTAAFAEQKTTIGEVLHLHPDLL